MKKIFTIMLLVICLILLAILGFAYFYQIPKIKNNAVLDNILERKSVRNYIEGKTIEKEKIEKMLRAAMAAPSARNMQPWEFVIVQDRNTLNSLGEKINTAPMLKKAPMAVVVLGNFEKSGALVDFWAQDTSAATENLLLEAEALGLGAVWIGVYPKIDRMKIVIDELNLPNNVIPLNIISIGYPDGTDKPKDKWNKDNIHYEKY